MSQKSSKRAVVLLSGGLDSSTVLAMAKADGHEIYALSFRYGQRHDHEVKLAKQQAGKLNIQQHVIIDIDLRIFGGSALTSAIEVPKNNLVDQPSAEIPITYVPARNTIFLSYALAFAEVKHCDNIFIGVNAVDYSGYPDCRPEYIRAFAEMARLATKAGVEGTQKLHIHTPLINLTKAEIIKRGTALSVDYSLTTSCYDPDNYDRACGLCDACQLRLKGFAECGIVDPVAYQ